jgi:peptide/nickel transport system substrate-binding protein
VDTLTAKILEETDQTKRDALIEEAWTMTINDIASIPLHQQGVAWGVRNNLVLKQRADNQFDWRYVTIKQ